MDVINVLVIEDSQKEANKLQEILPSSKYKYWMISDANELENMLKSTIFAVVLTELRMPYMNGLEVTKAVVDASPGTSVVVMTAYSFISFAVEAMEAGAYGYITKPFNSAEIRITLERAAERYSMMLRQDKKEFYQGLSVKDGLTGLYNRRFLDVQLKNKIALLKEETYRKFSLVMIDVDDFKKYNDTEGHQAGDKLLGELAKLFLDSVRDVDLVFRYGGEEFCILLEGLNKKEAAMIAERIRTIVSLYIPSTISLGVSTFPDDGGNEADLIAKADKSLYIAKRTGKNKVVTA
ncbi:MAG: diguanylate cyclase [PVC group bacterium]|nr:diguanylate cyclase [PVC group bacterium]